MPNDTQQKSEPQVRCMVWLDALAAATDAYEKKALDGMECGPEWKIAIRSLVRECYQDGFREGLRLASKDSASNDGTQP